jgi:hypothetical protein
MYPVLKEKPYVTHEYFKNLITGNFVNHELTRYIQDYTYFIGNDIMLPDNQTYKPFPSSLKWIVLE